MYLWYSRPAEGFLPAGCLSTRVLCPIIIPITAAFLAGTVSFGFHGNLLAAHRPDPMLVQRSGKAPAPHVGSAMAVLATLEQAQVLPPENTKEANQVIKSVIQFQSAFAKSTDPAIQDFLRLALTKHHGEQAAAMLAQFRSSGWTSDVLNALAFAVIQTPADELQPLAAGLGQFNLSVEDLQRFMRLVREAEQTLSSRGLDFHQVFASHRKEMPGATVH